MLPQNIRLSGATFGNCQHNIRNYMRRNVHYTLQRDPENKFDKNAIRVLAGGKEIGWIPKDKAEWLAPMIDAGEDIRCQFCFKIINDKNPDKPMYPIVKVYKPRPKPKKGV